MRAAIGEQIEAAIDAVGTNEIEDAIDGAGDALRSAYRQAWTRVFVLFAGRTYDAIEGEAKSHGPDHVDKWTRLVDEFLMREGATRLVQVDETTKSFVRNIVRAGVEEGLGIPVIKRNIESAWEDIAKGRAERIARTEIVGASNAGGLQGARDIEADANLDLRKIWLASIDSRTRDQHRTEHRQERPRLDEPFIMDNGDRMQYPGDPNGSAENVVNCRCTVIYEVE